MELIREAGFPALISLALFCVGLVHIARTRRLQIGTAWAALVGAVGMMGSALGQRVVDKAIQGVDDVAHQVKWLSAGTAETTANLMLSGAMALLLVVSAAAISMLATDR